MERPFRNIFVLFPSGGVSFVKTAEPEVLPGPLALITFRCSLGLLCLLYVFMKGSLKSIRTCWKNKINRFSFKSNPREQTAIYIVCVCIWTNGRRFEGEEGSLACWSKNRGSDTFSVDERRTEKAMEGEWETMVGKSCCPIVWKLASWVKWPRSIAVAAMIRAGQIHWVQRERRFSAFLPSLL